MDGKRILFIGCVESSYKLLSGLAEAGKNVVGVITKRTSEFNADYMDLTPICEQYMIPCLYVQNVNDESAVEFARSLSPELCYCFGWSQLLKQELLGLFPLGVVGFHPAALPHNRGRHPIIWALALGLDETASTFFAMNSGADEGTIISQKKVEITYEDDARSLYDKVMAIAVKQELEFTEAFENGTVRMIPQDLNEGNSWRKRSKSDGQIDWRMTSRAIYNLVRSITKPYVGAHFVCNGEDYKVWKVQEINGEGFNNIEPGKVLEVNSDGTMDVKVYDGVIRLVDFDKPQINKGDYLL